MLEPFLVKMASTTLRRGFHREMGFGVSLHNLLFPATRFKVSLNQFSSFDTFLHKEN